MNFGCVFYDNSRSKLIEICIYCNLYVFLRYRAAVDAREETGILVRLASEVEFSPSQLARFILEQHYQKIAELGELIFI